MLRSVFLPLMFCIVCYGVWLVLAAGQYKDKFVKAKDWNTAEGRVIERSEGVKCEMHNPLTYHQMLVCRPSISYAYTINGTRYEKVDELPPVLTFVRLTTREIDPDADQEIDFDEVIAKKRAIMAKKGPQEPVDIGKHIFVDKDKGLQIRGLGQLSERFKSTEEEKDLFRPKVTVKYRAGDPSEAITAKDEIKGGDTMFWSGVWAAIAAVLAASGLIFHEWVIKPSADEPELMGSRSVRY